MIYAIRHVTRYRYSRPVWQSMMEVRMHPRSEERQRCFTFRLSVNPKARIFSYQDHLGNHVYHFDLPHHHHELTIVAESLVNVETPPLPVASLSGEAWDELRALVASGDHWPMLLPSHYARESQALQSFAREIDAADPHGRDPLTLLHDLNRGVYDAMSYRRHATRVNSPIEESLERRQGVCQDFAHVTIALARGLGIPCRYVSGYLYHGDHDEERTAEGATHAWVEALMPGLGWVGFDPANNLIAGDRHIRTAVGRDYADVPPTRGMMKGRADTELQVRVRVAPSQTLLTPDDDAVADEEWSLFLADESGGPEETSDQQQQQQQQ